MISDQTHQELLDKFKAHLLEVNRKINLVSRHNSSKVVDDLIADSLAILELVDYPRSAIVLDVGSGAGFPWIVHKIVRQDLQIISFKPAEDRVQRDRRGYWESNVFLRSQVETVLELDVISSL
jgi:16S rRNA G527 N7-methylase RsmG